MMMYMGSNGGKRTKVMVVSESNLVPPVEDIFEVIPQKRDVLSPVDFKKTEE